MTNDLLGFNIGASEFAQFAHTPVTEAEVEGVRPGLYFTNKGDASLFAPLAAKGFAPYHDPLAHRYPVSTEHCDSTTGGGMGARARASQVACTNGMHGCVYSCSRPSLECTHTIASA